VHSYALTKASSGTFGASIPSVTDIPCAVSNRALLRSPGTPCATTALKSQNGGWETAKSTTAKGAHTSACNAASHGPTRGWGPTRPNVPRNARFRRHPQQTGNKDRSYSPLHSHARTLPTTPHTDAQGLLPATSRGSSAAPQWSIRNGEGGGAGHRTETDPTTEERAKIEVNKRMPVPARHGPNYPHQRHTPRELLDNTHCAVLPSSAVLSSSAPAGVDNNVRHQVTP
jgi:hypothetical protein